MILFATLTCYFSFFSFDVKNTFRHNLEHNSIACVREEVLSSKNSKDDDINDPNCFQRRPPSFFRTLSGIETLHEQGRHLIRVPTIEPILNRRWFIEQIETILHEQIKSSLMRVES